LPGPSTFGTQITQPGESAVSEQVTLGLNKSTIIDLGAPAADVVITNPDIADAVVQTSQRIIFRGMNYGQTNAFVFDRHGNQILNLEINVEMDMASIEDMIARHVPGARVKVEGLNGNVVITGTTDSLCGSRRCPASCRGLSANADDQTKDRQHDRHCGEGPGSAGSPHRRDAALRSNSWASTSMAPSFGDLGKPGRASAGFPERLSADFDAGYDALFSPGTAISRRGHFQSDIGRPAGAGFPLQQGRVLWQAALDSEVTSATPTMMATTSNLSIGLELNALERIGIVKHAGGTEHGRPCRARARSSLPAVNSLSCRSGPEWPHDDRVQALRCRPRLYAGGVVGRPYLPEVFRRKFPS
jgi:pilus assembly protein CpaC